MPIAAIAPKDTTHRASKPHTVARAQQVALAPAPAGAAVFGGPATLGVAILLVGGIAIWKYSEHKKRSGDKKVGKWQKMQHEEANTRRMKDWKKALARELAKPARKQDQSKIRRLQGQIGIALRRMYMRLGPEATAYLLNNVR